MPTRGTPSATERTVFHLIGGTPGLLASGEPQRAVHFSEPADLPVEQPMHHSFVINLKTVQDQYCLDINLGAPVA